MRGFTKLLVVLIVSSVFAGCTSDPNALTAAQRAAKHAKSLEKAGLQYYWKSQELSPLLLEGERVVRTYLLDENFYCLTNRNRLMATNAANGTLRWSRWVHAAKPGILVFDPVHADGVTMTPTPPTRKEVLQPKMPPFRDKEDFDIVVISTRTNALVIDRKTGRELRDIKFTFGVAATAGVAVDGRFIFVPDSRGWYHAILIHEMLTTWTLSVDGPINVPPVYIKDKVIVASEDGSVQVANTYEARRKVWTRSIKEPVDAPMIATQTHLLVPCTDRRLHAFDPITGQRIWEPYDCKKALKHAPQMSDVSVFQYANGGEFHALDLVSGELRWTLPQARKVLAAMKSDVYLQDKDNGILLVDEILGEVKTKIDMPGLDLLTANTNAPGIYGSTPDGKLYCIRRLDAGHLTAKMLRTRTD